MRRGPVFHEVTQHSLREHTYGCHIVSHNSGRLGTFHIDTDYKSELTQINTIASVRGIVLWQVTGT
jgi:hypothetical protein